MPTARDTLLGAARGALTHRPWPQVRMTEVAAAAGVSRQTLYNEFGSKEGLARALVRAEADRWLDTAGAAATEAAALRDPVAALAEVAARTVTEARAHPLLRALLTGCRPPGLPAPGPAVPRGRLATVPAQRRADAGTPGPAALLLDVRERALAALAAPPGSQSPPRLTALADTALRLALSHLVTGGVPGELLAARIRAALAP